MRHYVLCFGISWVGSVFFLLVTAQAPFFYCLFFTMKMSYLRFHHRRRGYHLSRVRKGETHGILDMWNWKTYYFSRCMTTFWPWRCNILNCYFCKRQFFYILTRENYHSINFNVLMYNWQFRLCTFDLKFSNKNNMRGIKST